MKKSKIRVYFIAVMTMVMWSMTFVWFKIANEVYPPFTIVFLRLLVSSLVMLGIAKFASAEHSLKAILNLGYLAIFGSSLASIFFTYCIRNIGATRTEIFTNLIPVFTAVFAWYVLGEELGPKKIIGIVVVLAGLFLSQMKSRKKHYQHFAAP